MYLGYRWIISCFWKFLTIQKLLGLIFSFQIWREVLVPTDFLFLVDNLIWSYAVPYVMVKYLNFFINKFLSQSELRTCLVCRHNVWHSELYILSIQSSAWDFVLFQITMSHYMALSPTKYTVTSKGPLERGVYLGSSFSLGSHSSSSSPVVSSS